MLKIKVVISLGLSIVKYEIYVFIFVSLILRKVFNNQTLH